MKITIFGATGMVGRYLVQTALQRGHEVNAFGRNVSSLLPLQNEKLTLTTGDLFEPEHVKAAQKNADAVISALGGDFTGTDSTRSRGIQAIIEGMRTNGIRRIIAIGGGGLLEMPNGQMIMDGVSFDKRFLPVSEEHRKAWHAIQHSGMNYTFFCPPTIQNEPATGSFSLSKEAPPPAKGWSITAGDLALAIVREAETGELMGHRIGIAN